MLYNTLMQNEHLSAHSPSLLGLWHTLPVWQPSWLGTSWEAAILYYLVLFKLSIKSFLTLCQFSQHCLRPRASTQLQFLERVLSAPEGVHQPLICTPPTDQWPEPGARNRTANSMLRRALLLGGVLPTIVSHKDISISMQPVAIHYLCSQPRNWRTHSPCPGVHQTLLAGL